MPAAVSPSGSETSPPPSACIHVQSLGGAVLLTINKDLQASEVTWRQNAASAQGGAMYMYGEH